MEALFVQAIERLLSEAPVVILVIMGSPALALMLGWQWWLERRDRQEHEKQLRLLSDRLEPISQTLMLIAERLK